jgi:hypothetical protein
VPDLARDIKKTIYIPHDKLEIWVSEGKMSFEDNVITILSGNRASYKLSPAYKFVKLTSGNDDSEKLLGKIKTKEELKDLNPDIFHDSIIIGNRAYEVEMGYIGNLREDETESDDIALLSKYILENL